MTPTLGSDHIDDTVQAIVRMHADHDDRATPADRLFIWLMGRIATPRFIAAAAAAAAIWIAVNLAVPRGFDPPPFNLLQGLATLAALFMTMLILAARRHDDRIATQRGQLSLQLAMLNDRKLAKLIELLEEQRRDHPTMPDRIDTEAEAMAKPADPHSVLDAIERG